MPSQFATLANRMDDACDAVFGENWTFTPMKPGPGGGLPTADPGRSVRPDVIGIFEAEPERSTEFGSEARGSVPRTINKPELSIDRRQFAEDEPPRTIDRFVRDNGEIWEVSDVPDDSEGRYKMKVKQVRQ